MPVQVNRMRNRHLRINHKHGPLVRLIQPHHPARIRKLGIVFPHLHQARVAPLHYHGRAVHVPPVEVVGVLAQRHGLKQRRARRRVLGHPRHEVRQRLVDALVGVVVARGRGLRGGGGGGVAHDAFDVVGAGVVGAGGLGDGAQPEVGGGGALVGGDDDVVALACSGGC